MLNDIERQRASESSNPLSGESLPSRRGFLGRLLRIAAGGAALTGGAAAALYWYKESHELPDLPPSLHHDHRNEQVKTPAAPDTDREFMAIQFARSLCANLQGAFVLDGRGSGLRPARLRELLGNINSGEQDDSLDLSSAGGMAADALRINAGQDAVGHLYDWLRGFDQNGDGLTRIEEIAAAVRSGQMNQHLCGPELETFLARHWTSLQQLSGIVALYVLTKGRPDLSEA